MELRGAVPIPHTPAMKVADESRSEWVEAWLMSFGGEINCYTPSAAQATPQSPYPNYRGRYKRH